MHQSMTIVKNQICSTTKDVLNYLLKILGTPSYSYKLFLRVFFSVSNNKKKVYALIIKVCSLKKNKIYKHRLRSLLNLTITFLWVIQNLYYPAIDFFYFFYRQSYLNTFFIYFFLWSVILGQIVLLVVISRHTNTSK